MGRKSRNKRERQDAVEQTPLSGEHNKSASWRTARVAGLPLGAIWLALLAVAAVVGIFLISTYSSTPDAAEEQLARSGAPTLAGTSPERGPGVVDSLLRSVEGYPIGSDSAPVVLYEVIDFQCPACRTVATEFMPVLKSSFVDNGSLRIVLIDFPLPIHSHAEIAARAARCSKSQGAFEQYHDLLFARQGEWGRTPRGESASFVGYAGEIGLDEDEFERCLESEETRNLVESNRAVAEQIGITGTPTFLLNGRVLESNGDAVFSAIESALTGQNR